MFALADLAVYAAILGRIGERGLQAVTTNMALNFLRRPEPGDILADVELLAFGKRLIVRRSSVDRRNDRRPRRHRDRYVRNADNR